MSTRSLVSFWRWLRSVVAVALVSVAIGVAQSPQIAEDAVVEHLNRAISWYRQLAALDQDSGQASDVLYLSNARTQSKQVLQLAFQSAQSIAALQDARPRGATPAPSKADDHPTNDQQTLATALQSATDRLNQDQAQIAELDKEIARARGAKRQELISRHDALQGVIPLDKALQEQLQKMSGFVSSNEHAQGGLAAKIAALKQSVPELFATGANETSAKPASSSPTSTTQNVNVSRAQSSGLVGLASYLLAQTSEIHKVENLISQTKQPACFCNIAAGAASRVAEGAGAARAQCREPGIHG